MSSKKIRVGVIGTGFIGVVHIETLRRLGNVEVAAIADVIDSDKKAERLSVKNGYADYKEMIDQENLDAVHLCTPNCYHLDQAAYAIEKGIGVLCEKPLTTTLEEAAILRDLAKKKNVPCGINFMFRFNPMVRQIREMIKNGDVGRVYSVHGSYLQDWLYFDTDYNWRLDPEISGTSRAFADIGSHWIDMVEDTTGLKAVEVLADFATFHKNRKKPRKPIETYSGMALKPDDYETIPISTEDYATVLFHFSNGAHGCCVISQMFAGRKNSTIMSIAGSKCSLHWDSEAANELWIGRRETYNQTAVKDPSILCPSTRSIISYPGGHSEGFADTFKHHFIQFYKAVAAGDPAAGDYATFEDGYREMILCEKIIESAKTRQWVKVG